MNRSLTAVLEGTRRDRIRKLEGFARHHREPDTINSATGAFVRKAGQPRIEQAADTLYREIRQRFGLKRRELEYRCENGSASILTPDFHIETSVTQSPTDPNYFVHSTRVPWLRAATVCDDPRFLICVQGRCDQLRVESAVSIDLEDKIDRIEAIPELAGSLDYPADASHFELRLEPVNLHLKVDAEGMRFTLIRGNQVTELLDASRKLFELLTRTGLHVALGEA